MAYGKKQIHVANPAEKTWCEERWLLHFGAYADVYVLAYGSLEDALESAAEYLADDGYNGIVIPHDAPAWTGLLDEAREEKPDATDDELYEMVTVDLTHTESGYIASWEWGYVFENPTNKQLSDFYHRRA